MNNTWGRLKHHCVETGKEYRFLLKPTVILFIIYLFGISALLRANVFYIDDLGRARFGYVAWDPYSRYLSEFFAHIVHGDGYLTDVSPLPQVLAAFVMALASTLTIHIISGKKEFSLWSMAAVMPLALSPYFLECFSYKYDAPYMAFSVLISIVPLLFCRGGWKWYVPASFLGTMCMCLTYQASTGVFPMLVVMVCVRRWVEKEDIGKIIQFALVSAAAYAAAVLIFNHFLVAKDAEGLSTNIVSLNQLIPQTIAHYKAYVKLLIKDFKLEWLALVGVICVSFVYVTVRCTKQYPFLTLLLAVPAVVGMFALAFGVYPFLTDPGTDPRCMYGIGVFLAFLGVYVVTSGRKVVPAKLACLVLSWMFFVFAFTYGNALDAQEKYTDFRLEMVMEDLTENRVLSTEGSKQVRVTGTIGYSPLIRNMPQDHQILNRLVPVTFQNSAWWWGPYKLMHYYGFTNMLYDAATDCSAMDLPLIVETDYHTIRANEEYIWIHLYN